MLNAENKLNNWVKMALFNAHNGSHFVRRNVSPTQRGWRMKGECHDLDSNLLLFFLTYSDLDIGLEAGPDLPYSTFASHFGIPRLKVEAFFGDTLFQEYFWFHQIL